MVSRRRWTNLPADRVYLSKPSATRADSLAVAAAVEDGWLSPSGPDLQAFEDDFAALLGVAGAVALVSGTAALHLGLKYLGLKAGDYVLIPTVTFSATAFAANYLGAKPIFIDVDESWNMDPELIRPAVAMAQSLGGRVTGAIPVDLYGTPANMGSLTDECARHGIQVLEDSAEALGARVGDGFVGSTGIPAAFSFNGNKIITTSGGGMLVSDNLEMLERVRYWAAQSREPVPWYEHVETGYNYRLSNVLAALGRSQLARLPEEVLRRRSIRRHYGQLLHALPGVRVQDDPTWGTSNAWLSIATFDHGCYPGAPMTLMRVLEKNGIEARPTWKPLHQQPVFANSPTVLTGRGDRLFEEGLCLPSGSDVTPEVVERVCHLIESHLSQLDGA